MKRNVRQFLREGKQRRNARHKKARRRRKTRADELCSSGRYTTAERVAATSYGGVGLALRVAERSGLKRSINKAVHVLKQHQPYSEADHVLNIALNALCGGASLQDIEHRRNDAAFLEMLGTLAIPDPTTAGDFCRRFNADDVEALQDAINEARLNVWQNQGAAFAEKTAILDIDSTIVGTTGECKEGMELTYKGAWGYHPLLVTYANTNEPLFIVNRSGARPSAEGAPALLDKAIALCRRAGHESILMRGDTAFSMTRYIDKWHEEGVRFVFGLMANSGMMHRAGSLEQSRYEEFVRDADKAFAQKDARKKQPRVKERIVEEREYKNLKLEREDIAEFRHKPGRADHTYRVVVLRKTITEHRGQLCLGNADRYFFYLTNDFNSSAKEIVRHSNQRCAQEDLIGELKHGVNALRAPLNTLLSNNVYMLAASLAWSLKAWFALSMPVTPRWRTSHAAERRRVLRMGFRTFVQELMLIPIQVVRTGRKLVLRVLTWRPSLAVFFRLAHAFGFA